ncbi:MAG: glycosyltransferase family 4 protein [Flavobacteriales bacterium]
MNTITRGLMEAGHEVKILTIVTEKHPFEPEKFPEGYAEKTGIEGVFVDTKVNAVDAFAALITSDSYNISRFFSPDFDMLLARYLRRNKVDVIHMESLFMTPYIKTCRRHSKAPVVLRSHNLEFMIWERVAKGTRNVAKRSYMKYLSSKLKAYEMATLPRLDGIVAISPEDRDRYSQIGYSGSLNWIPFGVDLERYPPQATPASPTVFHLGSMDWLPNIEGMHWFLLEVWPLVIARKPDAQLYLAGRAMPEELPNADLPGVHVLGEVESAIDFMHEHKVMVVPVHSAGGIRIKIIEGMALEKAIVSTEVGAEGIEYADGHNIRIANDPQAFATAIVEELEKEDNPVGRHARTLIEEVYDNRGITQRLVHFYQSLHP